MKEKRKKNNKLFRMKSFYRFLVYLSMFNLGMYAFAVTHEYTVEWYRWAITAFFALLFNELSNKEKNEMTEP